MEIDVVAASWVELHDDILVVPKEILDEAHLYPIRGGFGHRYGDVFPAHAVRGQGAEFAIERAVENEHAIVAVAGIGGIGAMGQAVSGGDVKTHS